MIIFKRPQALAGASVNRRLTGRLTETQARQQYPDIDIYKTRFTPMKNTLSGIDEKALIKMIVVRGSDRVVGIHMAGPDAPEIIQGMAVAIRA
ncbi:MAG: hypothetical protein NTY50_22830, partial [Methylobacter sp.]|nr:hypothetical protein [Methylobacter sp.]